MSLRIPLLLAIALLAAAASLLPATTAGAASLGGWNRGEQRAVRQAGVMHNLGQLVAARQPSGGSSTRASRSAPIG
jgi:hypothetical protein